MTIAQSRAAIDAKAAANNKTPTKAQIDAANKKNNVDLLTNAVTNATSDKSKAEERVKNQDENIKFKDRVLKAAQAAEQSASNAAGMKGGFLNNLSKLWF